MTDPVRAMRAAQCVVLRDENGREVSARLYWQSPDIDARVLRVGDRRVWFPRGLPRRWSTFLWRVRNHAGFWLSDDLAPAWGDLRRRLDAFPQVRPCPRLVWSGLPCRLARVDAVLRRSAIAWRLTFVRETTDPDQRATLSMTVARGTLWSWPRVYRMGRRLGPGALGPYNLSPDEWNDILVTAMALGRPDADVAAREGGAP